MKYIFLLVLNFLAIFPFKAQQIDFAPVGAKWSYYNNGWPVPEGLYYVECVGDTLVANRTCRKLCCLFPSSTPTPPAPFLITQSEDSIFFVYTGPYGTSAFQYLFKTSYEVGDSVIFPSLHLSERWYEVTAIDTLLLNGHTVRCFNLYIYSPVTGGRNIHVYDVFGPYLSFIAPWLYDIADGFVFELRSYEDNNIPKATISNDNCDIILATSIPGLNLLKISPNPVLDKLSLSLPESSGHEKSWVFINDLAGKTLLRQNIAEGETTLDVSHLPRGFYHLFIQGQKASYQQKFIKN